MSLFMEYLLPPGKQTHPTEKNTSPHPLRNEVPFQETITRKKSSKNSSKATKEKVSSYSIKTSRLTWSMQSFKEP